MRRSAQSPVTRSMPSPPATCPASRWSSSTARSRSAAAATHPPRVGRRKWSKARARGAQATRRAEPRASRTGHLRSHAGWRTLAPTVMRVSPLRGYRYRVGRERDLTRVVAPPYDQISAAMQERLYAMSPANIVRVSYPADQPRAGETADKYLRAHETLDAWLREGVWAREEWPAIYPYTQTYHVAGREVTRTGFVALG